VTRCELECFNFVRGYIRQHGGVSPSYREIMAGLGNKSYAGTHRKIHQLIRKGYLAQRGPGKRVLEVARVPALV
jgi:SOS-response transcriptional repressor LexA